jgi:hypothetical protein
MNSKNTVSTPRRSRSIRSRYVVCVNNDAYAASLEKGKIYQLLPDAPAKAHNLLRIVDESGEDYLYPADWFMSIAVSPAVAKAITSTA